jgi:thiol:disulfide interchange protein DsbC
MFPLPMHAGAREQSIASLCDKKGFEEFEAGYKSENQCAEGKKKVEETIAFLQGKGIGGTPTYILPDGRVRSGVMEENDLLAAVGKPVKAAPAAPAAPPAAAVKAAPAAPPAK